MFGAGHNMNKNVQQNRKQLASKRFNFKRNSKNSFFSDKSIVLPVKTKKFSKEETERVKATIRENAKKEKKKLLVIYITVFAIIITAFRLFFF